MFGFVIYAGWCIYIRKSISFGFSQEQAFGNCWCHNLSSTFLHCRSLQMLARQSQSPQQTQYNPFFGTRPVKKGPPVSVKDDFNPFKYNKVAEASAVCESGLTPFFRGYKNSICFLSQLLYGLTTASGICRCSHLLPHNLLSRRRTWHLPALHLHPRHTKKTRNRPQHAAGMSSTPIPLTIQARFVFHLVTLSILMLM